MQYEDENIWLTQKIREVAHYNLQMITAVGSKVNACAVQFRKWVGKIVKDYTIQGWTMDDFIMNTYILWRKR